MKINTLLVLLVSLNLTAMPGIVMAKNANGIKDSLPGNGYGHCKDKNNGLGHHISKRIGNGHVRDEACDPDPEPVCDADGFGIETTIETEPDGENSSRTVTITYSGEICDENDAFDFQQDVITDDNDKTLCVYASVPGEVEFVLSEDATSFHYAVNIILSCDLIDPPQPE